MEVNKEEAKRALSIAQAHVATDPAKALRFAKKAHSLYASAEAESLIAKLVKGEGSSNVKRSWSAHASSSATSPANDGGVRSRHAGTASSSSPSTSTSTSSSAEKKRDYTPKQMDVVNRVKKCQVTEYYEILELKKDCEETHVKSAYRKLALALHPDKNGAPGADEAFKMVSKAFQVLSDPNKRALYDEHGSDPDSRVPSGPSFSRGGGGMHPGFRFDDGAVDPEEIFRMFFGGGMGMGPGMQFTSSPMGGARIYTMGGGAGPRFGRYQRGGGGSEGQAPSIWVQLLPLLALLAISLVSMLPNLSSLFTTPDPTFSWSKSSSFPVQRTTFGPIGVKYHVNPTQFAIHPLYSEYLSANPSLGFSTTSEPGTRQYTDSIVTFLRSTEASSHTHLVSNPVSKANMVIPKSMKRFEATVENAWVRQLQVDCQYGNQRKEQMRREAMGFLGIGADWDTIRKLDKTPVEACEELSRLASIL